MTRWKRDLSSLHPGDAAALRRYATVIRRRHPKENMMGEILTGIIAKTVEETADRLDAGDLRGHP